MEFYNILLDGAASLFSALNSLIIALPWADLINAIIDVIPKL